MIGIAIALIVVGLAAMVAMVYSQGNTVRRIEETQLRQISADTTVRKLNDETIEIIDKRITNAHERIDNIITIHNAAIEHYDSEIDQIINRLNEITADIARIDKDEKEIRSYYINFRTPTHPNGGYTGGFVCKDDQDEQEEENEQSV